MEQTQTRTTEVVNLHQTLMDKAYQRWQDFGQLSKEKFWESLADDERFAVFTGNLNYQVQNGGFDQWLSNRYGTVESMKYLIRKLKRIATPAMLKVANLVEQCHSTCDEFRFDFESGAWADDSDDERSEYVAVFDKLDDAYYTVDAQFMFECELALNNGTWKL